MATLDSRAGKDTFVNCCQEQLLWCGNFSTVDFVKEVATMCGWDGTKTPKNRAFLSDLKDLLTKWDDVPYKKVVREICLLCSIAERYDFSSDEVLCFIHCREPEEIQKFVDKLGAKTLLIRRAAVEDGVQSNHADEKVFEYKYDYTIDNNGTIDELRDKARQFMEELGYKHFRY